jgi:predicted site-specific integrase-resolvase
LHRWSDDGRIQLTRAPGGERLYAKVNVSKVFGDFCCDVVIKKKICYAQLFSDHYREKSQVGILDKLYPGTEIIKDIGSGLNFKKKSLSLLDQVYLGRCKKIIVLYNDRL